MSRTLRYRRPIGLLAVCLLLALAAAAPAVDVVIFKDGFSLKGVRFQEMGTINDNGMQYTIPKARGFDCIDVGAKFVIFSNRAKQVGKLLDGVPAEKDMVEYKREVRLKGTSVLPAYGEYTVGEFDETWKRRIHVKLPGGNFHDIEQRIARISPLRVEVPSTTHRWYPQFDTREFTPAELRRLLTFHPDLSEKGGPPDPLKRLAIAQFFKDAGLLAPAREEVEKAKKDIPGDWPKEAASRMDTLAADLAKLEAKLVVEEIEIALSAGRYDGAKGLATRFDEKAADAETVKRFTELRARAEDVAPRYEATRRLLRLALDELGGNAGPVAAVGGGPAVPIGRPPLPPIQQTLLNAGEQVLRELHPDTAGQLDFFYQMALQDERDRAAGRASKVKAVELLALAASGWAMGKNGADKSPDAAAQLWEYREALLAYQIGDTVNTRRAIADEWFRPAGQEPVGPDVLAQVIANLPPSEPDDLDQRSGTKVEPGPKVVPGVYLRNTGPLPRTAAGADYYVRLPSEYTHGRPYPVLLALSPPGLPAEHLLSLLSLYADRYGYILAAPVWANQFEGGYDWKGTQHYLVQSTLRSLIRHYRVDNDRVFLFGFGEGANFAVDVGASHPDLFAGVVAIGTSPKSQDMMMVYWPNYQKLPLYVAIGGLAGTSYSNVRRLFEDMMPKGFPALAGVYKGRGTEWFPAELPAFFDWMGRKKRATGADALKLDTVAEEWQTMREADNRFYCIGTDQIADRCLLEKRPPGKGIVPAKLFADVLPNNTLRLKTQGTRNVIVWLDRTLIDWTKPVRVTVNGGVPHGYRPKVLQPDVDLMLEHFREHGDRSMLVFGKLEFQTVP